MYQSIKRE